MSKWEEKRLSEVFEIISGGTPKTEVEEYWNGDIPWLSVKDFAGDSKSVLLTEKTITELGLNNSATKMLYNRDIIISARGTVGEIAQIKIPMAFNQSCYGLRAKRSFSPDFLFYGLKFRLKQVKAVANGAVFDTIVLNTFDRLKVSIPDLPTQKRIADILSTYDDLIENNNRRIELLEKAAQELYKEWFVRFRFPNHENTKFVNGLPEGWEVKKLSTICDIGSSKRVYLSDYVEQGVPFYRSKEIIQLADGQLINESLYISEQVFDNFNNKFGSPNKNDILITSVGTIGKCYISDGHKFYFKDGNLTWLKTAKNPQVAMLVFGWLNSSQGQLTLLSSTIGTSQSALTIENLKKIKLIMPSEDILIKFANQITLIYENKNQIQKQNQNLKKQRDLLLPRLMSGKLEV